MGKALLQVFRVQSAMTVNRLLFWLKKLPLVKRALPDGLYGAVGAKQGLMAGVEVFRILWAFGGKFIYLFLCCLLPVMLTIGLGPENGRAFPMFLSTLFFLSFFVGCFLAADSLAATLVKYTCVRQMGMDARACIAATTGRTHVQALVGFTPALIAFTALLGQPWWYGAVLSLELAACRALGEALHLGLFLRWGKQPGKNPWFIILMVFAGVGLAYVPLLAEAALPMGRFLLNPAVAIALIGCGAWAGAWMCRFTGWRGVVWKTCRAETVSSTAAKASAAQNAFKDVQMKESDLDTADGGGAHPGPQGLRLSKRPLFPPPPAAAHPACEIHPGGGGGAVLGRPGRGAPGPGGHRRYPLLSPRRPPVLHLRDVLYVQYPGRAHLQGHVL